MLAAQPLAQPQLLEHRQQLWSAQSKLGMGKECGKRWAVPSLRRSRREKGDRCKAAEEGKASFPPDGEGSCKTQVLK